jgi:hypothetical protein
MSDVKDSTLSLNPQRRAGPHAPLPSGQGVAPSAAEATSAALTGVASTFREEDPRTRAARRAAELREHLGPGLDDDGINEFYIDPRIIPDGWSYEYKRFTVLGAQDPSYQVSLSMKGWEPVPASRHPELMPDNYHGDTIERKGMILMERPAEITQEAIAREHRKAVSQVRQKEAQLNGAPAGTFERDNKGTPLVNVRRSYEAIPIPEK